MSRPHLSLRWFALVAAGLALAACTGAGPDPADPATAASTTPASVAVIDRARAAVTALAADDATTLAGLADPARGVTFSPYAFIADDAVTVPAGGLAAMMADPAPRAWGTWDGSGFPIELTWPDYRDQVLFGGRDYAHAPTVTVDDPQTGGNAPDNSAAYFGGGTTVVEFSFPATDLGGTDWSALRLVFSEAGLVGVIRDVWTI
ncbi:MAG: hypothetical protein LBR33_08345 [Propionibacteriaceae bacterium]|jgi:hypothetical protein|nr:hypothetical protein [Propionibacteriaceae bacterium]